MQRYKKIAAISFLSMFSLYLLHQVVPHVHHGHDGEGHIIFSQAGHSHDHHHDHDHSNDGFDLLAFLLGTHTHTVHADNLLVVTSTYALQTCVKIFVADVAYVIKISDRKPEKQVVWQYSPDPTESLTVASFFLRGPPFLG